jgi:hypothetical protein
MSPDGLVRIRDLQAPIPKNASTPLRQQAPRRSIVITMMGDAVASLERLWKLLEAHGPVDAELIVACVEGVTVDAGTAAVANVVFSPPGSSQEELRRRGMLHASGDIVVFARDAAPMNEEWLARLLSAGLEDDCDGQRSLEPERPVRTSTARRSRGSRDGNSRG